MQVYRVFPFDPDATAGQPGHPDHVHWPAQGRNRLDNPGHYATWYYGATPEVAIGESFGNLARWSEEMFEMPAVGRRVLGVYEIADDPAVVDLDDANNLLAWNLRPTQVISRNRPATQAWALRIFQDTDRHGSRRWDGVRWWSYHRPHWTVVALWYAEGTAPAHRFVAAEELTPTHRAVESARATLGRLWH